MHEADRQQAARAALGARSETSMQRAPPLLRAAVAALLTSVSCSEAQDRLDTLQAILSQPLLPGLPCPKGPRDLRALWSPSVYDKDHRPRGWREQPVGSRPPTQVAVTFIPFRLGAFDTRAQLMTVDVEIDMLWVDPRLAFNGSCASELAAPIAFGDRLPGAWMPSIFEEPHAAGLWTPRFAIDNLFPSGSYPGFFSREHIMRVESHGIVWYSLRVSADVKCSMDFSKMPWDAQRCPIRITALEGVDRVHMYLVPDPELDKQVYQAQETRDAMSSVEWECRNLTQSANNTSGTNFEDRNYFEDRSFLELEITLQNALNRVVAHLHGSVATPCGGHHGELMTRCPFECGKSTL